MKREYCHQRRDIVRKVINGVGGDASTSGLNRVARSGSGNSSRRVEHEASRLARRRGRWQERTDGARRRMPGSGTYDPELNLYYIGTGNPRRAAASAARATTLHLHDRRDHPVTGKMAWHYRLTPHGHADGTRRRRRS